MNMVCMHGVLKLRPGGWTVVVPLCSALAVYLSHDTYVHSVSLNGEEEREC